MCLWNKPQNSVFTLKNNFFPCIYFSSSLLLDFKTLRKQGGKKSCWIRTNLLLGQEWENVMDQFEVCVQIFVQGDSSLLVQESVPWAGHWRRQEPSLLVPYRQPGLHRDLLWIICLFLCVDFDLSCTICTHCHHNLGDGSNSSWQSTPMGEKLARANYPQQKRGTVPAQRMGQAILSLCVWPHKQINVIRVRRPNEKQSSVLFSGLSQACKWHTHTPKPQAQTPCTQPRIGLINIHNYHRHRQT